jgi:rhodanese-related sulfurtransferase
MTCGPSGNLGEMIAEVSVEQLEAALAAGATLIDVREDDEYVDGHVPGAIHVPLSTVPDRVDLFRADGDTYVICKGGGRSLRACEFLDELDVVTINVAGGTMAWALSGRPLATGTSPS